MQKEDYLKIPLKKLKLSEGRVFWVFQRDNDPRHTSKEIEE